MPVDAVSGRRWRRLAEFLAALSAKLQSHQSLHLQGSSGHPPVYHWLYSLPTLVGHSETKGILQSVLLFVWSCH